MKCKIRLNSDAVPSISPTSLRRKLRQSPAAVRRKQRRELRLEQDYIANAIRDYEDLGQQLEEADSDHDPAYDSDLESMAAEDIIEDPDYVAEERMEYIHNESFMDRSSLMGVLTEGTSEKKFIISAENLLPLLFVCPSCHSQDGCRSKLSTQGAVAKFHLRCSSCEHSWAFSTLGDGTPAKSKVCNAKLLGTVLFTGLQPTRINRFMKSNGVLYPSVQSFFCMQKNIFCPAVDFLWNRERQQLINSIQQDNDSSCHLGGDARCDCMGYCAQFGSYSLMDLKTKKILDMEPISRVETAMSSPAMEKEGLVRGLRKLRSDGLNILSVTTDQHSQIAKMMRDNTEFNNICHYYDCWHVAKSIHKGLTKIKEEKLISEEGILTSELISSITNRLYYMAAHTVPGPNYEKIMNEKRLAILNHIVGIHEHPNNEYYKQCQHPPTNTKRMKPDSMSYDRVKTYLSRWDKCRGVKKMSPVGQTSRIESYHRIVLSFAPKHLSFGYPAMVARLLLATLHYNENCQREPIEEMEQPKLRVEYLKYMHGKGKAVLVRPKGTTDYIKKLLIITEDSIEGRVSLSEPRQKPPSMTSQLDRVPREEVMEKRKSRFSYSV